jgi:acyl carrier protein
MGIDSLTFVAVVADIEQELQRSLEIGALDGENSATPRALAQTIWMKLGNEASRGER